MLIRRQLGVAELISVGTSELRAFLSALNLDMGWELSNSGVYVSQELPSGGMEIDGMLAFLCKRPQEPYLADGEQQIPGPRSMRPSIWRLIVEILDLVFIWHYGAHVVESSHRFSASARHYQESNQIKLPITSSVSSSWSYPVCVQRQSLKCLNPLLGGAQVWVVQPNYEGAILTTTLNQSLRVCSRIQTLSEVWGPIWQVNLSRPNHGHFYGIGSGIIG